MLNDVPPVTVKQLANDEYTQWRTVSIRHNEGGCLADRFAAQRVWTWQAGQAAPREEWLILRIDQRGEHTYALSNAPADTSFVKNEIKRVLAHFM